MNINLAPSVRGVSIPAGRLPDRTASPASGGFTAQLTRELAVYEKQFQATVSSGHGSVSPFILMMSDYHAWKEQQPPQVLPGSQGRTEENLAYLRERYSGPLSLFQTLEALDTMKEMGIMTQEQYRDALGLKDLKVVPLSQISGPVHVEGAEDTLRALANGTWAMKWSEHLEKLREDQEEQETLDILLAWIDRQVELAHENSQPLRL